MPAYLINGEVYGPEFDRAFHERGIRQMIFTYTQASEPLFPNYYLLPESEQVNSSGASQADEAHFRPTADPISQMFNEISFWGARNTADMMGLDVCAWRDEGLHPETLSVRICNRGWMDLAPGSPDPAEAKSSPYRLFYGRAATNYRPALLIDEHLGRVLGKQLGMSAFLHPASSVRLAKTGSTARKMWKLMSRRIAATRPSADDVHILFAGLKLMSLGLLSTLE